MFPRIIPISESAKDLLTKIFTLNANLRPNLRDIESHIFFKADEEQSDTKENMVIFLPKRKNVLGAFNMVSNKPSYADQNITKEKK